MAILKEEYIGTKILNEVQSSNVVRSEYDTATKKLIVEFKNGVKYEYDNVPHQSYTEFRAAPSQGNYFNLQIAKKYKIKRVTLINNVILHLCTHLRIYLFGFKQIF
jgi:hypothetical protein